MKKTNSSEKKQSISDADVELALHVALRDAGVLVPRTDEDVADLEAGLDISDVPAPDTDKFRLLLRDHVAGKGKLLHFRQNTSIPPQISDNLAMAARNGLEISDEVRRKMDSDRHSAEQRKQNSNDAT